MSSRSSKESFLTLNPNKELTFTNPGQQWREVTLTLTNNTELHTYFKIKVTAPRHYSVRPNQGEVPPNSSENVTITLTNLKPSEIEDMKDKFLVQSIQAKPGESTEKLFKDTPKNEVGEAKLLCRFVIDGEGQTAASGKSSVGSADKKDTAPVNNKKASETEADKEKIAHQNQRLKNDYAQMSQELEKEKKSKTMPSSRRSDTSNAMAPSANQAIPYPMIIIALLIGFLIGHFLNF